MVLPNKPSEELLRTCRFLKITHEKEFIFTFKGHEVNLSTSGERPLHVMLCIATQLAEKLTDVYNEEVKTLFGL